MDPLSVTTSIIAILQLSNKVLGYLNDAKDASKERERCAVELSNLYGLLVSLRCRLEESNPNTPWHTGVRALAIENGPLDQFRQALELLQARLTHKSALGNAGEAIVWKFKKDEVANILSRMERLKTLVQVALQMDHLKLSQATKDDTFFIRTQIPAIQSGLGVIRDDQQNAQHNKLMSWISSLEFPAQQSDIIGERQEGTGEWFLADLVFVNWLQKPHGTLFCPGVPGAGKTMISAIVIEHLLDKIQSSNIGIAFVYCNYKAQEEQKIGNLLSAILKQLVQVRPSIAEAAENLWENHAYKGTKPSVKDIFATLQAVLGKLSTTYIVVDALDECKDGAGTRRQLLDHIKILQTKHDLRFMITSRNIPEIEEEFKEAMKLEIQARNDDMRLFITGQIFRLPKCIRGSVALQAIVQDKIIEAAEGMFLLAPRCLDSLLDQKTKSKVESKLSKLRGGFDGLTQTYDDAIKRITSQLPGDTALAKRILAWITNAQRPLTTTEICHALAVEPKSEDLDPDNVPDVDELVSVCAGLVVVDKESQVVRFVHYTAHEYFERSQEDWSHGAHADIASTCLAYLSFDIFRSKPPEKLDIPAWLEQNPFLGYAAQYWGKHILPVQDKLRELAYSFLSDDALVSHATRVKLVLDNPYCNFPEGSTGLHLTARFGLRNLLADLLSEIGGNLASCIDEKNSLNENPLFLAAYNGHENVVALLLENGANINEGCQPLGSPLQAAAYRGHDLVVKLLIDRDAKIDTDERNCYGTALQVASAGGHTQIVELLLDKGANVDVGGGTYGTALQVASAGGHTQIVELLLDKGTNVDVVGNIYGTALQVASAGGHTQIVELLLDKGANVDVGGGTYSTALQAASVGGHTQIVELLLDKGANVDVVGNIYGTALQVASAGGHTQIVELLLDKGANVDVDGGNYGTALQAASAQGDTQIVELLLDSGANTDTAGAYYGTALQAASARGYTQIVELLLDKGANVNVDGGNYGTALQAALAQGHTQIVELLLEKGANANCPGGKYGSFLGYLAHEGYENLLRIAREKNGARFCDTDFHGRSLLHIAAKGGNIDTFNYLLSLGLDPKTKDAKGDDLLSYASSGNSLEILNVVLGQNLPTSLRSGHWSPLHWACKSGNQKIIERLVESGQRSECVSLSQPEGQWSPYSIASFHGNSKNLEKLSASCKSLLGAEVESRAPGLDSERYDCDGCFQHIRGPVFQCRNCFDLDYCFMCKPFLSHLHKGHIWDCFEC
ncbi:ankyrin repeat-containing domain protein [Phaeosphaeriaceae sp. PMI808]|nr:ankyrin repeat-containing domain protein [Phaeosphaeriaceae sp. PMI808]